VASSWILFFIYQDDAQPKTHQILLETLVVAMLDLSLHLIKHIDKAGIITIISSK